MTSRRVLKKLRAGAHVLAAAIGRVDEPGLAEVVGRIGFDFIWFDLEHRWYGMQHVDPMSLACCATGIDLMVHYPPLGKRGFDGVGADADWGLANPHEQLTHANREVFLVLQIEDLEAVEGFACATHSNNTAKFLSGSREEHSSL